MDALELVETYGPTPLNELTARLSAEPVEVASQINSLVSKNILKFTDEKGQPPVDQDEQPIQLTEDMAKSKTFLVSLTSKGLRRSLAGW